MLDTNRKRLSVITIIKMSITYSPLLCILLFILTIIDGLLIPMMIGVVANFIDSAMKLTSYISYSQEMIVNGVVLGLVYLYMQLSQEFKIYFYERLEDRLRHKLKAEIVKKQFMIEYQLFESSEIQDLILRVTKNIEGRFIKIIKSTNLLITITIQIIGVLYILLKYNYLLVVIFIFLVIPFLFISLKGGKVIYESEKKVNHLTRKMNYFSDVLSNREASSERILFNYSSVINERFKEAHLHRSNFNTKTIAKETIRIKMCNILVNIYTIVMIVILSKQVQNNLLSVGLFAAIIASMINLTRIISIQVSNLFLEFSSHVEYTKDFKDFLDLKENKETLENKDEKLEFEKLKIKELYFKYKDSANYILKGINLHLEKGKSYSLVGLNGAGKTTLIKILVGLYKDYEGQVLINGKDLKSYTLNQLRSIFSLVSQDYAKYQVSLKDNITLDKNKKDVNSVLDKVGLNDFVNSLKYKENSNLGKLENDGIDISGGQWQKIAISRALYKDSPFIILDEPTSNLSPTAESKIYSNFSDIASSKTLLMISHRLGSTSIADEIIVLDNGFIKEKGSHYELMENDKIYKKLFNTQREMYNEE